MYQNYSGWRGMLNRMFQCEIIYACAFTLVFTSSCVADSSFEAACNDVKSQLRKDESALGSGFDKKFDGELHSLGEEIEKTTTVEFGGGVVALPYLNKNKITISSAPGSQIFTNETMTLHVTYYTEKSYSDVRTELLFLPIAADKPVFEDNVFHEWLAWKGFEVSIADLDCSGSRYDAEKTMSYLAAKVLLMGVGSDVYRLADFDVGYLEYNRRNKLARLVVLNSGNRLEIRFSIKDAELFERWAGL